jgi:hypothetical protein
MNNGIVKHKYKVIDTLLGDIDINERTDIPVGTILEYLGPETMSFGNMRLRCKRFKGITEQGQEYYVTKVIFGSDDTNIFAKLEDVTISGGRRRHRKTINKRRRKTVFKRRNRTKKY